MRVGRVIVIAACAVIALPILYLAYLAYSPHLLFNETTRYLYQYRDLTMRNNGPSLIPGLFSGGEEQDVVNA